MDKQPGLEENLRYGNYFFTFGSSFVVYSMESSEKLYSTLVLEIVSKSSMNSSRLENCFFKIADPFVRVVEIKL